MLNRIRRFLQSGTSSLPVMDSVSAYALWASDYPAEAHNALMQVEERAMLAMLPDVTGLDVLDLACGTGRYGQFARAAGAQSVIGLDNSAAMLHQGKLDRVALATMNAIPLSANSMDVILCGMAIGHLPDISAPIAEISRILKPGGICLLSDFHPFQAFAGAQRSFHIDGQSFAVEHYPHTYSIYHQAMQQYHLSISQIDEVMIPGHIMTLPSFPLTPNKKIDRKALPEPTVQQPVGRAEPIQSDGIEGQIATIWARILGVGDIR
ncbi:MAG: methyltransferase domain-containing protein, partial [Aggregatilineales bacterium]